MKAKALLLLLSFTLAACFSAFAQQDDQITDPSYLSNNAHTISGQSVAPRGGRNGQAHARFGISGVDSIPNFNQHFQANGVDPYGNNQIIWYTNTVGNPPELGGTTSINAPIIPVSLDLRNADGSIRYVNGQRLYYDATQYAALAAGSPVFQNASWSTSNAPTQITDAIQRAEYWSTMRPDWHTLLATNTNTKPQVMILLKGTYRFALNADGSCCRYVLVDANVFGNALFPPTYPVDNTTVIGSAELDGDITTKSISTLLFPNTFLYLNGNPSDCCVLGYHTFDYEPGVASNGNLPRFYVVNYSSWISPGLFGGGFADDTAISHEVAETFNDPFVTFDNIHDVTPFWKSPNGNCQDSLEVGDVIEGLPQGTYPITMPNGHLYHPQNEALLQWFQFQAPSTAFQAAYSYPNTATLTSLSAPQKFNCGQ